MGKRKTRAKEDRRAFLAFLTMLLTFLTSVVNMVTGALNFSTARREQTTVRPRIVGAVGVAFGAAVVEGHGCNGRPGPDDSSSQIG